MHLKNLGSLLINLNQLNKNKISICTEGHKFVYKREIISDALKHLLKDLLNGKKDLDEKLDLLSDKDQIIFNEVLNICQIDNDFSTRDYNVDENKNNLIERFNILKDELLIGNESEELFDEFREIVNELFERKLLTKIEYTKLIKLIPK